MHIIENEFLKLTVAEHGAEIKSLINKATGEELMWQADSTFWGRTAPVLFPVVGNYYQKKSIYDNKVYEMGQHGFARDMDFDLVLASADKLVFELKESKETLEKYPFEFLLTITYTISGKIVDINWNVKNVNNSTMYFSIGGHPAFNCDLDTYTLRFTKNGSPIDSFTANIIANDGSGCLSDETEVHNLTGGTLKMSDDLFSKDALIIENEQADAVTLVNPAGQNVITVTCPTPLFGVWSPVGKHAPFVCIEPWCGRCDRVGFNQLLEEREHGNILKANEEFNQNYQFILG